MLAAPASSPDPEVNMRSKHHSPLRARLLAVGGLAVALSALGVAPALPAAAGPVTDPAPIGPGQWFSGEVNGVSVGTAIIKVACPTPVTSLTRGHPVAGQTVAVEPRISQPVLENEGFTGTAATHVVVDFGLPSAGSAAAVTLSDWAVQAAVPTGLSVPCSGTGTVSFTPVPTSVSARAATVSVQWVSENAAPGPVGGS
jgi:hypothetical protein